MSDSENIRRSAALLREHFGDPPPTAIVLGSGLGPVVHRMEDRKAVPSVQLGFPQSTVVGHAGRLVKGTLGGHGLVAVSGRVHLYEGLPPSQVVRGVRALKAWGVRQLLLTASVGGITDGLDPGELMLVTDHLNLQGSNPLTGPPHGTRFPDLTFAYAKRLRKHLAAAAEAQGVVLHQGIYAAMPGPSYETPAEVRMLKLLGADVVGMSTVPEVIAAAECNLDVAAIAVVSNRAAGLTGELLDHDEVTENANEVATRLADLVTAALAGFEEGT